MATTSDAATRHSRLSYHLRTRQAELQAQLATDLGLVEGRPGVTDFKELAAKEATVAVNDVTSALAARELDEVTAALGRLADGSYGTCMDCGELIDERRLIALPATPVCTQCQSIRETRAPAARY